MKGSVALALFLFCGFAWSQPQQPTPSQSKDTQKEKTQTSKAGTKNLAETRGTESAPLFVKVIETPHAEAGRKEEPPKRDEPPHEDRTLEVAFIGITALATVVLAIFTITLSRSTKKLWEEATIASGISKSAAETALLQARAAVAAQIPVVVWGLPKMVWVSIFDNPTIDPVPPGMPPDGSQLVFNCKNLGPTTIKILNFGLRWEVREELIGDPIYQCMQPVAIALKVDESHWLTVDRVLGLSQDEQERMKNGTAFLWVYGFLIYTDFLDESHTLGMSARWDMDSGFIISGPPSYNYSSHEKNYAKLLA